MVPVTFSPQRFEAMGIYGDVTLLTDPYLLTLVINNVISIINNIPNRYNDATYPLVDYLESTTAFASRADEHMMDIWFNQGRVGVTAYDLSNIHLLLISASRMLASDVLNVMYNVLNYKGRVHDLKIQNNVGVVWVM